MELILQLTYEKLLWMKNMMILNWVEKLMKKFVLSNLMQQEKREFSII